MEVLQRLKEREFLFVTSEARNKFRSLLKALEEKKHIALAYNSKEPMVYRENVQELYEYVSSVRKSLTSDDSYTRPHIYTGISKKLKEVIEVINQNQSNAIFIMMNKFLVIRMELERLIEQLRN